MWHFVVFASINQSAGCQFWYLGGFSWLVVAEPRDALDSFLRFPVLYDFFVRNSLDLPSDGQRPVWLRRRRCTQTADWLTDIYLFWSSKILFFTWQFCLTATCVTWSLIMLFWGVWLVVFWLVRYTCEGTWMWWCNSFLFRVLWCSSSILTEKISINRIHWIGGCCPLLAILVIFIWEWKKQ